MAFNAFDIVCLVFAAIFIIVGVRRGLIGEIFRFIAMVGGLIAAIMFYPALCQKLGFLAVPHAVRELTAFFAIFIVTALILIVIGWLLTKIIRLTLLGWVDRVGGGIIGLAKALLIIWLFVLSVSALPKGMVRQSVRTSHTFTWARKIPFPIDINKLDNAQKSMEKFIETKAVKPVLKMHRKFDTLRTKVDSAKAKGTPGK